MRFWLRKKKTKVLGTRPLEQKTKVTVLAERDIGKKQKIKTKTKIINEKELTLPQFAIDKAVASSEKLSKFENWAARQNREAGHFMERSAVGILVEVKPKKYKLFGLRLLKKGTPTPGAFTINRIEASEKVSELIEKLEGKYGPRKIRLFVHHSHPAGFKKPTPADINTQKVAFSSELQFRYGEPVIGISHEEGGRSFWDGQKKIKLIEK